ncbi:MAG: hypothetical protein CMJ47_13010 [Planctomyces sp.]|nr:hypothetical protein [Planctomyces sp.]
MRNISGVQSETRRRIAGFTLIELLIAVTIFIILTTLAVSAFNLNVGSERVSAASRQVQAMLEGARARAFKLQKPVGVRFQLDPNYPSELTGMTYISTIDDGAGSSYETGRLRFIDYVDAGGDGLADATNDIQPAIQQLTSRNAPSWTEMRRLGVLKSGVRIRIPAGTGTWYTVSSENFLTSGNVLRLVEEPVDVSSYGFVSQNFANNTGKIHNYELDLSTVMMPLAGEDEVQLPPNTVIDLLSSKVPSNWYISRWQPGVTLTEGTWIAAETANGLKAYRATDGGTTGTSAPNWNSANTNGTTVVDGTAPNDITWRCYDAPLFDVIFTPQGSLFGPVAAEGVLHFTLAETRDTREVFDDGSIGLRAYDLKDRDADGKSPDHLGSFRLINVFASSGAVSVSPIDQTDVIINSTGASGSDDVADNLFNLALDGATAN